MARYSQHHLEVTNLPMAVLVMDTIGFLPITSKGIRWALTPIHLQMSWVLAVLMEESLLKMYCKHIHQAY